MIKRETDYFLQPETGQPVRLNSSRDLSQHVGHQVRVEGNVNNGATSNEAAANSSYGSNSAASGTASTGKVENGNTSPSGTQYQTIDVTRVDMISKTCPSGMQNQSAPTNNTSQSPK